MTTVYLNIAQLPEAFQKLGPRLMSAAQRGALRGAYRAVATLQMATSTATPASKGGSPGAVNTGFYKRAWTGEPTNDGARVYNSAPYASILESGRRAKSALPPISVIAHWAQRKLGLSAKEAKAAAFPIARAIAKRGLRGRKILKSSQPKIEKDFITEVLAEITKELEAAK